MTIYKHLRFAALGAVTVFYVGLTACSPRARSSSGVLPGEETASQLPSAADTLESADPISVPPPPRCLEVERLIGLAVAAAKDGQSALSHRLLTEAVTQLGTSGSGEQPLRESIIADLYEEIVRTYTQLLPSEYADSASEQIAMLVFQRQLARSYDTLSIPNADSLARTFIACEQNTEYNVPIVHNERVIKALHFFSKGKKGPVGKWLDRSTYYLPMMKRMYADSGLPTDLAYLPLIESGFNPKAYSWAHASGLWQFISATGRRYGLRRSFWLDERRDPIKSTASAISYLKELHAEFGHWYLALAAYNCGEGNVRKAIRRSGTKDFWQLRLPRETMNYVPQFIAALIVAKNPSCFGFTVRPRGSFDLDTVYVSECLDLSTVAEGVDTDADALRKLNPHMLRWCTPPDADNVLLYMPSESAETFRTFVATLDESDKVRWHRYRIRRGDNLISIAHRHGISVSALKSVNGLRSNRIIAGKYLLIPLPGGRSAAKTASVKAAPAQRRRPASGESKIRYRVKAGDTVSELADLFGVRVTDICRWNEINNRHSLSVGTILIIHPSGEGREASTARAAPKTTRRTYRVTKGDNLHIIARHLGVRVNDLFAWNRKDPSHPLIHPGETLVYYAEGTAESTPRAAGASAARDTIVYRVSKGDNLTRLTELFSADLHAILRANGLTKSSTLYVGDVIRIPVRGAGSSGHASRGTEVVHYKVKKGDNLWNIAHLFRVPVQRLYASNGLDKNSRLMPGDILKIPVSEEL